MEGLKHGAELQDGRPVARNRGRWRAGLYATILLTLVLSRACGGDAEEPADGAQADQASDAVSAETVRARNRAADYASWPNREWALARTALVPLVTPDDARAEDLLRAACIELADQNQGNVEAARALLARAEKLEPKSPVLLWCKYRIARLEFETGTARDLLLELRAQRPGDFHVQLSLAMVEFDLGNVKEAEDQFRAFLDLPRTLTTDWRMTALYKLRGLLVQDGRMAEATPFLDEWVEFNNDGVKSPGEPEHQVGTLGAILPSSPTPFAVETSALETQFTATAVPDSKGVRGARSVRLDRGAWPRDVGFDDQHAPGEELWQWVPGERQLVTWGDGGLKLYVRQDANGTDGKWGEPTTLIEGPVYDIIPFDRENHGAEKKSEKGDDFAGDRDLDFLALLPSAGDSAAFELRLLNHVGDTWTLEPGAILTTATSAAGRIVPVDFDHDGDVDLVAALDEGTRLLRNDGFRYDADEARRVTEEMRKKSPDAPETLPGAMTDVTDTIPFPAGAFNVVAEDVDGDQDVDFVLAGLSGQRVHLMDDQRGGTFVEATNTLPNITGEHILVADFDGSSWTDIAAFGDAKVLIHRQTVAGAWTAPLEWPLSARPTGAPQVVDFDLDGTADLIWPAEGVGIAGLLSPGFAGGGIPFDLAHAFPAEQTSGPASLQVVDLDDDHDLDILYTGPGGAVELIAKDGGQGLRLDLMGFSANAHGIGAIIEARAGLRYRRIFWSGEDGLIGFGDAQQIDLRVTATNGVKQEHFDLAPGSDYSVWGRVGLQGSCPFLYTWNGETYEYITDVLGITPLGLPMGPGMIVPPDHDEYVLVRGDQLVPKDGMYELQFTEELREVTYLDRVRLDVIDHPEGTEIFPNERFSFPPFPEAHVHTVRDPLLPLSAVDGRGKDWTKELAANDEVLAAPFDSIRGQLQGLATPHFVELSFDPERVAEADKLRLVMNGWFFWTNASVNMAAARDPMHSFVPPILQVPDGNGGWRDTGPPIGFPAGKLKTMVFDVTELLNREDPRIRLFSTLRLYWDSIRLAVDDDERSFVTTSLEPKHAHLWERGFSAPIQLHGEFELEWFDWDRVAAAPRWNQHPGIYTRLGDTLPLLEAIDDLYCVMGAGDALTIKFDASEVPPLREGWTRDYLVFLDGWAKDRDPNSIEALNVEPLPFHGMSGYPYGADESFPTTEAHQAWRREWQTRPAKRHIEPFVSRAAYSGSGTPPQRNQPHPSQ